MRNVLQSPISRGPALNKLSAYRNTIELVQLCAVIGEKYQCATLSVALTKLLRTRRKTCAMGTLR